MTNESQQKLLGRLSRLGGQVRSVERLVSSGNSEQVVTQLEAVIAAAKASLVFYIEEELLTEGEFSAEARQTLSHLISKF